MSSLLISVLLLIISFFTSCENLKFETTSTASSIDQIEPRYINALGGDTITFTGKNLKSVTSININNRSCTNLRKISSAKIQCDSPSNLGIPEIVDVDLNDGKKSVRIDKSLTYGLIIGQSTSSSVGYNNRAFSIPRIVIEAGGKFILSDASNHRVLIYNSIPASPETAPDIVLGQTSLSGRMPNTGGVSASTLNQPIGLWSDGTKLVINDFANHRVLLWNSFPTRHGQPADVVLGQANFTTNIVNNGPNTPDCGGVSGRNACSFNQPAGVMFVENKLIITDHENNRILIWDGWPFENQKPADHILGQPDFFTGTANNGPNTLACGGVGGRNACSFWRPAFMEYHLGKFFLVDASNNRVLIFNAIPTTNGTPADLVLGQPTFLVNTVNNGPNNVPCGGATGVNACSFNTPFSVTTNGTKLYIADYGNNRILGWDTLPTTNQEPADFVLGQNTVLLNTANKGQTVPGQDTLRNPYDVRIIGGNLVTTDLNNNRVLFYNGLPGSGQLPTNLLGHESFIEGQGSIYGTSSDKLQLPSHALNDGAKIFITDRFNNRLIIENSLPTSLNDTSQRVTLGQPNHTTGLLNNGPNTVACGGVAGLNACSLNSPIVSLRVGPKLVVSDFSNNRILIWNTVPTTMPAPADLVLGQGSFTTNVANSGPNTVACGGSAGVNKCSLSSPIGLASDGTNLIVADYGANRILIWDTFPTTNQEPADFVLGQPGFTSVGGTNGPNTPACDNVAGLNRCSLFRPFNLVINGTKLIAADSFNNRVLIWNTIPTANQQPADVVIGFNDFITNTALIVPTITSLSTPAGVCTTSDDRLVVSDYRNNRVLVYNTIPTTNGASADLIIGQSSQNGMLTYGGGPVGVAKFNVPYGISCKGTDVYIADLYSSRIHVIPLPLLSN